MRISTISIKNFKSIDELIDLPFNDRSIACIIGRNGSGKSNLLYAIKSLKDDEYLKDTHQYEKESKDKEIIISATIILEEVDESLLKEVGLTLSDIGGGFNITVRKPEKSDPQRTFEPLDFNKDFTSKIKTNLRKIHNTLKGVEIPVQDAVPQTSETPEVETPQPSPEPNPPVETPSEVQTETQVNLKEIVDRVNSKWEAIEAESAPESLTALYQTYLKSARRLAETNNSLSPEVIEDVKQLIEETANLISFDISNFLKELWENLTITLLRIDDYVVETRTKRTELKDSQKHPFLYDLLSLSKKKIDDFDTEGPELSNTQRDASTELSRELAKVWPQHKINFKIEAQDVNIFFSFETPQERSRGLEDLSDGEKWFLRFYTKLAIANQQKQQTIWLFDEPGQSLHATSQIDLKSFFEETSLNSQIIYTSHQPMMIQWHRLERILVADNSKTKGTSITTRFWKDEELVSPLREALGLFVGEQLLTGVQHVVVEGISDYVHLQGWLGFFQRTRTAKHWEEENSFLNRTLIPAGGRDCIPLYLLFLSQKTKDEVSTIAIPDSKNDADLVKKAITDYGLLPTSKVVKSISELVGDSDLKDIEEVYETKEFLEEVKNYYTVAYPNIKIPSGFEAPKSDDLKEGVVSYVNDQLNSANPKYFEDNKKISLDKPGVAFSIYSKLNSTDPAPFSKTAEKKFEKIFMAVNGCFKS